VWAQSDLLQGVRGLFSMPHLHPLLVSVVVQEAACLSDDDGEPPALARRFAVPLVLQVAKRYGTLLPESVTQKNTSCD
jgi:hypothetical protein